MTNLPIKQRKIQFPFKVKKLMFYKCILQIQLTTNKTKFSQCNIRFEMNNQKKI